MRNKNLTNTLFAAVFIPYLLLCLTIGGLHGGALSSRQCGHMHTLASCNNADATAIGVLEDNTSHNSETCQICQWLKTPSNLKQFLVHDVRFDCVYSNPACHSSPILPSLFIQKFTIRPPPSFSCTPV